LDEGRAMDRGARQVLTSDPYAEDRDRRRQRHLFFGQDQRGGQKSGSETGIRYVGEHSAGESEDQSGADHLRSELRRGPSGGIDRPDQSRRRAEGFEAAWISVARAGGLAATSARGRLRRSSAALGVLDEPAPDSQPAVKRTSWSSLT